MSEKKGPPGLSDDDFVYKGPSTPDFPNPLIGGVHLLQLRATLFSQNSDASIDKLVLEQLEPRANQENETTFIDGQEYLIDPITHELVLVRREEP
jgi:hypothetical protein